MGRRKMKFDVRKDHMRRYTQKRRQPTRLPVSLPISAYAHANVSSAEVLRRRLRSCPLLPRGWSLTFSTDNSHCATVFKVHCTAPHNTAVATFSLVIHNNLSWTLSSSNILISSLVIPSAPTTLSSLSHVLSLLKVLDNSKVCRGNDDKKYMCLTKRCQDQGSQSGALWKPQKATNTAPSSLTTIRHKQCSVLIHKSHSSNRCDRCTAYRKCLNKSLAKVKRYSTPHSHTNNRYLSLSQATTKLNNLQRRIRKASRRIQRLKKKIAIVTDKQGVCLDEETNSDLKTIITENHDSIMNQHPKDTFLSLFWQQQYEAMSKDPKGMRWHPMMVRWCLYLRHQSNKAYGTLRESGIALPSERTLRDYTHYCEAKTGFSTDVDRQLIQASKVSTCEEWKKYVIILVDEMYIREDLVYDKHSGNLIGYTDLGAVNNQLLAFERSLKQDGTESVEPARSMLVFMVKGLFTTLKFPYAQFACTKLRGDAMFQLFWEVVKRLEWIGLKVLGVTSDGASTNRKMMKMHNSTDKVNHKAKNIHSNDGPRDIFFFSDPPHLIKTVRNCWASKCRFMWCNGKEIQWQHLINLYEKDMGKCSGLALVPKLKYEHIKLTSFSKMRVDLAAQALSETVSKALTLVGGEEVAETARFVSVMDKFFDALNVSNFSNGKKKRKPFQDPYRSEQDVRLSWLKDDFLGYLDDWEKSVMEREGFDDAQKKRMMLSDQTLLGLRMTTLSFIDLVKFLFARKEVKENKLSFLSGNLCQDPLEQFFGCQRQRGGANDHPNVLQFCHNTQALRVIDSFCRGPVRGNCRKRPRGDLPKIDKENSLPLTKRKRRSK